MRYRVVAWTLVMPNLSTTTATILMFEFSSRSESLCFRPSSSPFMNRRFNTWFIQITGFNPLIFCPDRENLSIVWCTQLIVKIAFFNKIILIKIQSPNCYTCVQTGDVIILPYTTLTSFCFKFTKKCLFSYTAWNAWTSTRRIWGNNI